MTVHPNDIVVQLGSESEPLLTEAERLSIAGPDDYRRACELLVQIKRMRSRIEDAFAEPIRRAYEAHRAAKEAHRRFDAPLAVAEDRLRAAVSTWLTEERQRRAAAEQAHAATLQQALQTGDLSLVEALPVERPQPCMAGVSLRKRWSFDITDESLLPREFLMPNIAAIRERVNRLGEAANIPGVAVSCVEYVAVTGGPD